MKSPKIKARVALSRFAVEEAVLNKISDDLMRRAMWTGNFAYEHARVLVLRILKAASK